MNNVSITHLSRNVTPLTFYYVRRHPLARPDRQHASLHLLLLLDYKFLKIKSMISKLLDLHLACCKVESIEGMPAPLLVPADHVHPIGGVAAQGLDLECPVGREEVF